MKGEGRLLRRGRRVKVSILASSALLVGFVVLAFVTTVYLLQNNTRDADLARTVHAVQTLWEQKLERGARLMGGVVMAMSENEALAEAFAARDRERLRGLADPLFVGLRQAYGITHLYFNDGDLVNLLRLHKPGTYGDTINRLTTLQARQAGASVHGVEMGPLGTLTLRMVVPWRREGRLLGYVEMGEEIEHLLLDIRSSLGVDLLAIVDKRFLTREQWELGRELTGYGDWADFPSMVVVGQATDLNARRLATHLPQLEPGIGMSVEESGRSLYLASLPLIDAGGRGIGQLLVIRDTTQLKGAFRQSLLIATLVSVSAGLLVFLFFRSSLGKVEQDYRRQHVLERQLLRASAEHLRLVQIEKLSALGTMIGEIAHQLNNPLVGVINMAQLAERQVDDPERVRALLQRIRGAGSDCRAFVQRMLEFSKVSNSERRPADLRNVVHEAVSLFRQSAGRGVDLAVDLPDAPAVAPVDSILLRHALFNLLNNAAQASGKDGGAVTVALRPCCRSDGGEGWLLSVVDDGPGFPPEVADKLFTPFFTTRRDGTGLGLPVVMHVALVHDGTASAANRPEGGAEFSVWLPEDVTDSGVRDPGMEEN